MQNVPSGHGIPLQLCGSIVSTQRIGAAANETGIGQLETAVVVVNGIIVVVEFIHNLKEKNYLELK
jgi:hypothetical protein